MEGVFYNSGDGIISFLRFYPDNTVYEISVYKKPCGEIEPPLWFNKENINLIMDYLSIFKI